MSGDYFSPCVSESYCGYEFVRDLKHDTLIMYSRVPKSESATRNGLEKTTTKQMTINRMAMTFASVWAEG